MRYSTFVGLLAVIAMLQSGASASEPAVDSQFARWTYEGDLVWDVVNGPVTNAYGFYVRITAGTHFNTGQCVLKADFDRDGEPTRIIPAGQFIVDPYPGERYGNMYVECSRGRMDTVTIITWYPGQIHYPYRADRYEGYLLGARIFLPLVQR